MGSVSSTPVLAIAEARAEGWPWVRQFVRREQLLANYDRSETWYRQFAIARLGLVSLLAMGLAFIDVPRGAVALFCLYAAAMGINLVLIRSLERTASLGSGKRWVQLLTDFTIVAATVLCTSGPTSFFTFLFIVVVLEAGLILGFMQALATATFSAVFMMVQVIAPPESVEPLSRFDLWVNFTVQGMAFYLTAFVSGYWSERITRMRQFQSEILDNMNSGFLIIDTAGVVRVQNQAARELLNMGSADIIGRPISEVLRVELGGECPVLTALRLGRDFTSYEFTVLTADNTRILLGLTTSRIFDPAGTITGVIAAFTDLTEVTRMREELRRQDRLAVIGELAASLAHEIRNPVTIIRGAVDEMRGRSGDVQLQDRLRTMVVRESDHLNEIVTGFLDFAREPSIKREQANLSALLDEVGGLLRREFAAGSGLEVEMVLPAEPCHVSCDPSQLKQVFVNLGNNALEAMEGRGRLTILLKKEASHFEIRFEDEGPGIDPDQIVRIFEPFYTTKSSGVGMGLAVCLRIITAHDGTLRASAREGGGCSMRVLLPRES